MLETMKLTLAVLCALLALPAAALEFADWSWEDGLLGDSIDGDVFAYDGTIYPGYLCDACRDPEDHAIDYAAFAYNGYWGEDPWMRETRLGMPFRIYNLLGQWVVVWFEDMIFDTPSLLPNTLDVRIRLPDGKVIKITLLQDGPDIPIGADDTAEATPSCGCTGGDDSEGDDDYTEPEEYEFPEYEPTGSVEIIDPDENGEFPEWMEEL